MCYHARLLLHLARVHVFACARILIMQVLTGWHQLGTYLTVMLNLFLFINIVFTYTFPLFNTYIHILLRKTAVFV